ncbi:hypothetical protein MPTK1_2g15080 [Marchantia polymorpha subsp. ruderalis]|uniref:Uncharacterized protein n=2 Tax=Marchantia polymorpha TaxID=3197 RepID=A0A176VYS6_MARPO|nr:hypothetical protein AXG93_2145s1970 [Marchantia polymorpha subsp. ruderalis]PTQ34146.1 hypothetical protein MARPO_0082s0005 [Marchantia polymorpha]BBN02402.1 hypothetical protein Mp_2g15080 [Marchantia polymorpha subsp. ruderalis]|eukprot:PTQ34146.1 hypothetical protein MARPO_0082s0005 [Marchantia polymorpha]
MAASIPREPALTYCEYKHEAKKVARTNDPPVINNPCLCSCMSCGTFKNRDKTPLRKRDNPQYYTATRNVGFPGSNLPRVVVFCPLHDGVDEKFLGGWKSKLGTQSCGYGHCRQSQCTEGIAVTAVTFHPNPAATIRSPKGGGSIRPEPLCPRPTCECTRVSNKGIGPPRFGDVKLIKGSPLIKGSAWTNLYRSDPVTDHQDLDLRREPMAPNTTSLYTCKKYIAQQCNR